MEDTIPIAREISIREAGLDEKWVHNQIIKNPSCLGLGDLDVVYHERRQSSGGRLDLLLKDEDTMYEVEVMLGATDESHIIRTIEYWDNERQTYSQHQHVAVLVAESITNRFFNVILLLRRSVPIIAIQLKALEADGKKSLHFSKILDTTNEEPEVSIGTPNEEFNEQFWVDKAPWTLETVKTFSEMLEGTLDSRSIKFVKNYISLTVKNKMYFWFHKRSENKSALSFWVGENLLPQIQSILDTNRISYTPIRNRSIRITIDKTMIQTNKEMFKEIAKIVKQAWEDGES